MQNDFLSGGALANPDGDAVIEVDNDGRNATGLDDYLKSIGATKLEIIGLATDHCVLFTVLDARRLGDDVEADLAECRGVELKQGDVARAVDAMRSAGATDV